MIKRALSGPYLRTLSAVRLAHATDGTTERSVDAAQAAFALSLRGEACRNEPFDPLPEDCPRPPQRLHRGRAAWASRRLTGCSDRDRHHQPPQTARPRQASPRSGAHGYAGHSVAQAGQYGGSGEGRSRCGCGAVAGGREHAATRKHRRFAGAKSCRTALGMTRRAQRMDKTCGRRQGVGMVSWLEGGCIRRLQRCGRTGWCCWLLPVGPYPAEQVTDVLRAIVGDQSAYALEQEVPQ